jgi:hypothetical protein
MTMQQKIEMESFDTKLVRACNYHIGNPTTRSVWFILKPKCGSSPCCNYCQCILTYYFLVHLNFPRKHANFLIRNQNTHVVGHIQNVNDLFHDQCTFKVLCCRFKGNEAICYFSRQNQIMKELIT